MGPSDTPPYEPDGDGVFMNDDDYIEVISLGGMESDQVESDEEEHPMQTAGENQDDLEEQEDQDDPPEANSFVTFTKHRSPARHSVFTCDILTQSGKLLCVTGGEDDKALLWDLHSQEIIFSTGSTFKDSVTEVCFSFDGTYLAVGDLSGLIKVYKLNGSPPEVVWEFETADLETLFWHKGANILFAGTRDSQLWMWKIPSGDSKIFIGEGGRAQHAALFPDGKKCAVGFDDGTLRIFDLKTGAATNLKAGDSGVMSTAVRGDGVLVAAGTEDGVTTIFNTSGKALHNLTLSRGTNAGEPSTSSAEAGAQEEQESDSVESILFLPHDPNLLVAGSLGGRVTVWDVSSGVYRWTKKFGSGVVKLSLHNNSKFQVLASTLDGSLKLFDARNGDVLAECLGHRKGILGFAQSRDGNIVLTSSDDGDCRAFDLQKIMGSQQAS